MHDATAAGRGYACAGGVADAIEKCIHEYYPDVDVKIEHAEGLAECKKVLMLAKEGKKYLNSQGMIFMEIGYDQGQAVKEIFESEGFVDIVIKKDLCKNDRVVIGRII